MMGYDFVGLRQTTQKGTIMCITKISVITVQTEEKGKAAGRDEVGESAQGTGKRERSPQTPARRAGHGGRRSQRVPAKKVTGKAERDAAVSFFEERGVSERHACRLLGISRASVRYVPKPDPNKTLVDALTAFAAKRTRRGYRKA